MGTFINDQNDDPPFKPGHYVIDDQPLAMIMTVLKLLGKEASPLEIEQAYFYCKEQVRAYRRSR